MAGRFRCRQIARTACRIGGDMRRQTQFIDEIAALTQCHFMAVHMGQRGFLSIGQGQKAMVHTHEMLANNIKFGAGQKPMNIGNATGHGIFNRHHGQRRRAVAQSGKGIVETGAGHGLHVGITIDTGNMAISAQFPLKSYFTHLFCSVNTASACAKSAGVSTPTGTVSTIAA